jgi:hypothetical protein
MNETYTVSIKANYGKFIPHTRKKPTKKLSLLEKLLQRVESDQQTLSLPASVKTDVSSVRSCLVLRCDFPLKESEAYADYNPGDLSYWEHPERESLDSFLPIWSILLGKHERPIYKTEDFVPNLSIKCPAECYDFVERTFNHLGKTLDSEKADSKEVSRYRSPGAMGVEKRVIFVNVMDLKK